MFEYSKTFSLPNLKFTGKQIMKIVRAFVVE